MISTNDPIWIFLEHIFSILRILGPILIQRFPPMISSNNPISIYLRNMSSQSCASYNQYSYSGLSDGTGTYANLYIAWCCGIWA